MWVVALKSFEWTLIIEKPIRRYEIPKEGEPPRERPLTVANTFFDAADLLFNLRGLGWSWSSEPFPPNPGPPPSIPRQFLELLVKVTAFDTAHYLVQLICPSASCLEGGTIFDATLNPVPRLLHVTCISFCAMIVIYSSVEVMYHVCALFGQILLGQSAVQWPRIANRPWMSTSVTEFWVDAGTSSSVIYSWCTARARGEKSPDGTARLWVLISSPPSCTSGVFGASGAARNSSTRAGFSS